MLTIYRVEHIETKEGPYRINDDWSWMVENHSEDSGRPSPWTDELNGITAEEYCGFLYLNDLHTWFTGQELKNLANRGFGVREYEVPACDIRLGSKQVVFIHPDQP